MVYIVLIFWYLLFGFIWTELHYRFELRKAIRNSASLSRHGIDTKISNKRTRFYHSIVKEKEYGFVVLLWPLHVVFKCISTGFGLKKNKISWYK